jgi:exopolyphosphatase/guanosine-5'-triphosphate,3'-diphosphate pyrophosphatase
VTSPEQDQLAYRVGIVDIGSNSIRLVGFDLGHGLPVQVFNERALCQLGAGLAETGRLAPERLAHARAALARFAALSDALGLDPVFLLATAAVRDAANGPAFVADIEALFGRPVTVLSGAEEARYAALGVTAGLPSVDGASADLGGGSLDLAPIERGAVGAGISLPLGPLRLLAAGGPDAAAPAVDQALAAVPWLSQLEGRTLYAVGGAWRALAAVRMAETSYPLHVIHGYTLARAEAAELAARVQAADPAALAAAPGVSSPRAASLPHAALVLGRLLAGGRPRRVCFSAYGLREGYLEEWSAACGRHEDHLAAAADWLAGRHRLSAAHIARLRAFTAPLFADESPGERRLRDAACRLSALARDEHPDYRGLQALRRILRAPALPLRHSKRVFLALTLRHRYGGLTSRPALAGLLPLLRPAAARRAQILGLALRLAHHVSGGTERLLAGTRLALDEATLSLAPPPALAIGDAGRRDLASLAKTLGRSPVLLDPSV